MFSFPDSVALPRQILCTASCIGVKIYLSYNIAGYICEQLLVSYRASEWVLPTSKEALATPPPSLLDLLLLRLGIVSGGE